MSEESDETEPTADIVREQPKKTDSANRQNRRKEIQKQHLPDEVTIEETFKSLMSKQGKVPAKEYRNMVATTFINYFANFADYINSEIKLLAIEECINEIDSMPYLQGKEYEQVEEMLDRFHEHVKLVYSKLFRFHYNQIMKWVNRRNDKLLLPKQGFIGRTADKTGKLMKKTTKMVTLGAVDLERRQL